jgi:hypothetical protein
MTLQFKEDSVVGPNSNIFPRHRCSVKGCSLRQHPDMWNIFAPMRASHYITIELLQQQPRDQSQFI